LLPWLELVNASAAKMSIGIDDIVAAILLSFIMMRRLEAKSARAELNPHLSREAFESWRKLLLAGYVLAAAACALKVLLSLGWQWAALRFQVGEPWYRIVPAAVFVAWVIALLSAWRQISEARSTQERLQIVLRPSASSS
jgi:hypothetical protein